MEAAIERARECDCRIVQLSTDKARPDAVRFCATHEGMKLSLE